jgi:hypothetical protein
LSAPYDQDFDLRQAGIERLFERTGLKCEVTRRARFSDALDHIIHAIRRARFVVVDLEHERPSVMIEVGVALALEKEMLLLLPRQTTLPFNVARSSAVEYKPPIWTDNRALLDVNAWLNNAGLVPQTGH